MYTWHLHKKPNSSRTKRTPLTKHTRKHAHTHTRPYMHKTHNLHERYHFRRDPGVNCFCCSIFSSISFLCHLFIYIYFFRLSYSVGEWIEPSVQRNILYCYVVWMKARCAAAVSWPSSLAWLCYTARFSSHPVCKVSRVIVPDLLHSLHGNHIFFVCGMIHPLRNFYFISQCQWK